MQYFCYDALKEVVLDAFRKCFMLSPHPPPPPEMAEDGGEGMPSGASKCHCNPSTCACNEFWSCRMGCVPAEGGDECSPLLSRAASGTSTPRGGAPVHAVVSRRAGDAAVELFGCCLITS